MRQWVTLIGQDPADQTTASVTAAESYGARKCHKAMAERGAAAAIPPRKNAKLWKAVTAGAGAFSEALGAPKYVCPDLCRRKSGYDR